MLVEVKLTEKCKIIDIPLDRNSATVHTNTELIVPKKTTIYICFLRLNLFKHYSRTSVFIMFTQHFTSYFL
jgi:hypothetical protein